MVAGKIAKFLDSYISSLTQNPIGKITVQRVELCLFVDELWSFVGQRRNKHWV